jgi:hypothetical protein
MNSPSVLKNKSYSNPEAILTSPNVAPNAVRPEKHSGTATLATAMAVADTAIVPLARCSLQYAPIVARKQKCHSSHAKTDQYIAAIASAK